LTLAAFSQDRPAGGYGMIMADPPWSFAAWSGQGKHRAPAAHYDCMTLDRIAALPVEQLAARDSLLWLWATHPMVPQALHVMAAWGFQYKTSGVWVKRGASGKLAFGTGYLLRCASEPFLLGTRGKPKTTRATRSVIEGPRREHSRKPDEAFAAAEALMPSVRRVELFSRQHRPGWDAWGNEAGKFEEATNG